MVRSPNLFRSLSLGVACGVERPWSRNTPRDFPPAEKKSSFKKGQAVESSFLILLISRSSWSVGLRSTPR